MYYDPNHNKVQIVLIPLPLLLLPNKFVIICVFSVCLQSNILSAVLHTFKVRFMLSK